MTTTSLQIGSKILRVLFSASFFHTSSVWFGSVQSLSRVWLFVTPWIAARQASLSNTIFWSSLKLMSIKSVMPSSHLILCHPLLLLPLIPPSIRVFSNESTLRMRWPKSYIESISKFHCLYLQSTSQVFLHHPTSTHSSLVQAAFMSDLGDCSIFLQDLLVCPDSVEVALNVATSGFLSPPG